MAKSFTVLTLMAVLVGVLFFAGINGIMNNHSTGLLFIFVGICTGAGLTLDIIKAIKERNRKENLRKLRP
jgi:hypothetical protein